MTSMRIMFSVAYEALSKARLDVSPDLGLAGACLCLMNMDKG